MNKSINERFHFHIIFISMFPILAFCAHNLIQIHFIAALRIVLIVFTAVVLLSGFFWIFIRDIHKVAFIVSFLMLLFFSYGHVYAIIKDVSVFGFIIGRHRFLATIYFLLFILGLGWIRKLRDLSKLTRSVNLFGFVLFLIPFLQIVYVELRFRMPDSLIDTSIDTQAVSDTTSGYRDIYYIILDAYTRDDTMLSFYQYDNSSFLDALTERGFYIARCSQSNYSYTDVSMASSLNLDYIQEIDPSKSAIGLGRLSRESLARKFLQNAGYSVVSINNGYRQTQWFDADIYFSYRNDPAGYMSRGLTEFESMFLKTTAGLVLMDIDHVLSWRFNKIARDDPMRDRYLLIKYTLDKLTTIPSLPGPKFVYLHILLPHEPYIFARNGDFIPDPQAYIPGYRDHVILINDRMIQFIDKILSVSDHEPIIIIQGDHGGPETKDLSSSVHILNAYYLPDTTNDKLYETISPVNTFRLIFNTYFGTDYEYLPDISYRTIEQNLFDFEVVHNTRTDCDP